MLSEDLIYIFQTRETQQYCQHQQLATVFKEKKEEELTFNTVSSEGDEELYSIFIQGIRSYCSLTHRLVSQHL